MNTTRRSSCFSVKFLWWVLAHYLAMQTTMAIFLCLVNQILNYTALFLIANAWISHQISRVIRISSNTDSINIIMYSKASVVEMIIRFIILSHGEEWLWIHITQLFWAKKREENGRTTITSWRVPWWTKYRWITLFYKWYSMCMLLRFSSVSITLTAFNQWYKSYWESQEEQQI